MGNGNYCECEDPPTNPQSFSSPNKNKHFYKESWNLLKKHTQTASITPPQQNQIVSYLLSLPYCSGQTKVFPVNAQKNIYISCKQDAYFYLGKIVKGQICGQGAIAFPNNKIFIGNFVNNKIFGKGSIKFNLQSSFKPNTATIQGNWTDAIQGKIQISTLQHKFNFHVDKFKLRVLKNFKYIQYPNYDEYMGETVENTAQGFGKYIYRNGHLNREYPSYEGHFEKGVRCGRGILRYSESMELNILWINGKPDGHGYILINHTKFNVLYRNGQRIAVLESDVV